MTTKSVIEIKKYANRRLYDTARSVYITLADLAKMVQAGQEVKIFDAKSGDDLTAATLLQILAERQNSQNSALSARTLAHIIAYDNPQTGLLLSAHLDEAIDQFEAAQKGTDDAQNKRSSEMAEFKEALLRLNAAFNQFEK